MESSLSFRPRQLDADALAKQVDLFFADHRFPLLVSKASGVAPAGVHTTRNRQQP